MSAAAALLSTHVRQQSNTTFPLVDLEHFIGREVVFAALRAAKRVADLMFGAQVVDQRRFALEHMVAELAHELQPTTCSYKQNHRKL